MLHGIIKEIQADRKGEASRLNVVQTSIDTLIKMDELEEDILKHYVSSFEETLLYQTAAHYDVHCSQYLGDNDCSSYMIMASAKLEEEETRGRQILHPTTYPKLKATMEETVVDKHKTMMQEECINFLEREQVADIERLYLLLRRVDGGIDPILQTFEEFVVSEGTKGIQALSVDPRRVGPKDYTDYVELITALHARFSKLVAGPFHDDSLSVVSLDKACRSIINSKSKTLPLSIPELLAKFVDACLKRSSKAGSDEEIEAKQVRAIFVFKYIDDKDMFQKIYSKMLAKRLIHGNSISEEAEASMISKLKQRCGYEYTVKLQKMFTDITLSSNLNTRFGGTEVGGALPFNLKMLVRLSSPFFRPPLSPSLFLSLFVFLLLLLSLPPPPLALSLSRLLTGCTRSACVMNGDATSWRQRCCNLARGLFNLQPARSCCHQNWRNASNCLASFTKQCTAGES